MDKGLPLADRRETARLREHYEIEKELADRLRNCSPAERRGLYGLVYDELFQRVPDHPQLTQRRADPEATAAAVAGQVALVSPFLSSESTFLELGAGDCALSAAIAPRVKRVYAVDVSEEIVAGLELPGNVDVRLTDGTDVPVPPGGVDVAYSNQLMEHLHPDDAREQLRNIYSALAPKGLYLCITPNRLTGPHDISRYFDDEVATGFHLREYSNFELHGVFRQAGFASVRVLVGARGRYFATHPLGVEWFERLLELFPARRRRALASRLHLNLVLGIRILGRK